MAELKYYLNIDGVNGGSTDVGHVGWFEIDSYDFKIDNPSVIGADGSGTGKPTFSPLKINLSGATNPDLLEYIATGKTIKSIQLDGVNADRIVYSLALGSASVNNYDDTSTTAGDKLSFDYKQVAITTRSQKPDGSLDTPQSYAFDVSQLRNVATTAVPTPATPPISPSGSVNPTKYYLNIDGLNGGSTAVGHVGWFEIDGYDFNIDNPSVISAGGISGTGKPKFSPLEINLSGAANPELLKYIATGKTIKAIQLDGVNADRIVYSLALGSASVNNYDDTSTTAGDKLSFDYKQVAITTRSQKPDGSLDTPQSYAFDVSQLRNVATTAVPTPATPPISPSGSVSPTKYYLNIDGLNGGSTDIGHVGWFEIDGYDFNIEDPSVLIAGGSGTGKREFSPLKVNLSGAANPELLKYIATGKTIKAIQLDGVNADRIVYSLALGSASVNNYDDTSTTAGDKLSFDYKQVAITTRSQKPDGSLDTPQSYAFDVSTNGAIVSTAVPTPATPPIGPSGSVSPTKYYLNIDGLNGGSTAIGHVGWFEIDGYDFNIDNPTVLIAGGISGTGKPKFSPLKINLSGAANPELLEYIATGKSIKSIQLDGVTVGKSEQTVYSLLLGGASVTNYDDTSTTGGDKLAFNYKQVGVTTKSQKPDGSLATQSYAYDVSSLAETTNVIPTPATPPVTTNISVSPVKYYLNIDGLNGGSTAIGHVGWFEIDGYDFNIDNPSVISAGGSGTGKPKFSPLKVNLSGAANSELLKYIATGKTIKAIQLDGVTVGESEQTVYSLKLGSASVNNYDDTSTTAGDKLAFDYKQVAITTRSQKPNGSLDTPQSYAYDVSTNSAIASIAVPTPAIPPSGFSANVNPSKYYLYVDGLNGGSTAVGHVGWFEIDGYDFNIDNPSSVITGTGKPEFSPLTINFSNGANPDLLKYIATGKTIKTIQLDDVKAGRTVHSLKLGAVSVTGYGDVSTTAGDKLAFNYKQVAITTKPPTGSLAAPQSYAFDLSLNATIDSSSLPPITSFVRPNDFNGDSKSDILWRNNDGSVATWQMNGSTVTPKSIGSLTSDWTIAGSDDFNGDGKAEILLRNTNNTVSIWQMDGSAVTTGGSVGTAPDDWKVDGTGDFNGDGKADILWRSTDGSVATWQMDGSNISTGSSVAALTSDWKVAGTDDFDGDGKADILWRNNDGTVAIWQMDGSAIVKPSTIGSLAPAWKIAGTGDFNGDGKAEILLQNTNGAVAKWQVNGSTVIGSSIGSAPDDWKISRTGDFNGDGKADILWRNDGGGVATWQLDSNNILAAGATSIPTAATSWNIAAPIL
jgi:type VI protein secretion system component Hcp